MCQNRKKSGRKKPRVSDLDVQPAPDAKGQQDNLDPLDGMQDNDKDEPSTINSEETSVKDDRGIAT